MREKVLMGIDLGTSSVKALLIDLDGQVLGSAAREYTFDTPRPGWAEQDPDVWVAAAETAAQAAVCAAGLPVDAVQAIGLSGQMHGVVCVDGSGRPVRPAVIWADQRSGAQVDRVYQELGHRQLGEWTANPVASGFMLPTWLWLLENEPETSARTRSLVLPKDYLRAALTGRVGVEASDASTTLLFDTVQGQWSQPLVDAFGIDRGLLLPLHRSAEVAGGLVEDAARRIGLAGGTPVIFGGSDQPMALLGQGIIQPGQLSCAIATGGQLVTPLASALYDPQLRTHTFCHVLENRWYIMAATLSAGLALRWLRDAVFKGMTYQELADLAAQAPGSEGLFFLPHLAGERTPYMDSGSKAGFWGLTLRHNQGHMVRAVMEGVVFSLRACLDLLVELGIPVEEVVAAGGGTRHPLWMQLMANIFNRPIIQNRVLEASTTGAALLAGVGVGLYPDIETACARAVPTGGNRFLPDPASVEAYQASYETFLQLYPAFRQLRGE